MLQAMNQRIYLVFGHQIALANKNLIRKTHLAASLLAVVQLVGCMLGIHQGEDRIEQILLGNLIIHKKGLRYWARVGQPRGFNHHAFKI